jgi:hypothetical protein
LVPDVYGITQLYTTKSGAREWFSNWHNNSGSRAFRNAANQQWSFPAVNGQNQDPNDSEYLSMAGGPTAWFIDGSSGIATWKQEDNPPADPPPTCRPFIIDYPAGINAYDIGTQDPPRQTWLNVEITAYARFHSYALDGINNSFMRLSARSNHFNITNCNCDGLGYDFNLIGNPSHAYAFLINKEIIHPNYGAASDMINVAQSHFITIPSYSRRSNIQRFPLLRWIGMKFVVRNITSNGLVRLEAYRDLTNGNNGGDWLKLADITDDGIDSHWGANTTTTRNNLDTAWATTDGCGTPGELDNFIESHTSRVGNYNPIITRAGYSCYIRIDSISKVELKKFSVREIDPI